MSWIVIEPRDRKAALPAITRLILPLRPAWGLALLIEAWREDFIRRIGRRCARSAALWCRAMHEPVTWPIYGHYHCRRCHRTYVVPWDWKLGEPP